MTSSKSIRAKIKNIADANNLDFQSCVTRFLHERLLYRLSVSEYKNALILKGGNLIYSLFYLKARPTIDVDFLGIELKNDTDECKKVFQSILSIYCDDTVWFNTDNIFSEIISEQNRHHGIRLTIQAGFDTIKQQLQIDIGFGDTITPKPVKLLYPSLIYQFPESELLAYTKETVIAEKFQAMIFLADFNTRMKDFFDVYKLLDDNNYDKNVLESAIISTFKNRNTPYTKNHDLFTDEFAIDKKRNQMWQAFLKKINTKEVLPFDLVMQKIQSELKPIWNNLKNNE
ncbi:MAG: nucleotidyl transferase AbiEii/AbiGii toxin family protein [Bacteroidales bacterium]|nr:nucleotidyl transferase AbiEii/AbiGii toxin family protein [Bacteroidales bacterium]